MNPIRQAMVNLPGRWIKGVGSDDYGNFCGLGHVYEACRVSELINDDDWYERYVEATHRMDKAAAEMFPDRCVNYFFYFNDHHATTEADVLAVMEKAAIKLEETEGL